MDCCCCCWEKLAVNVCPAVFKYVLRSSLQVLQKETKLHTTGFPMLITYNQAKPHTKALNFHFVFHIQDKSLEVSTTAAVNCQVGLLHLQEEHVPVGKHPAWLSSGRPHTGRSRSPVGFLGTDLLSSVQRVGARIYIARRKAVPTSATQAAWMWQTHFLYCKAGQNRCNWGDHIRANAAARELWTSVAHRGNKTEPEPPHSQPANPPHPQSDREVLPLPEVERGNPPYPQRAQAQAGNRRPPQGRR
ncbi:hypothetical protein E2C01_024352 [Portunus trituberculatus]|uniref:Uncharacterized protein n=1 Tax=Portunus trituberculatus TaxID=210409 RepID=A0A5B7ECG6_PORTR|nr:hypothetical protein [Portunus trituberculatus]